MITYWTWSGVTPERSSAALMANPPRSAPEKSFNEPSSRPIGVRAPLTMTDPAMDSSRYGYVPTVTSAAPRPSVNRPTGGSPGGLLDWDDGRMSLFTRIDHVGIAVPDLDEAIAFYRDTFGVVSV